MKKQFCTYEIALKFKELGFDEECLMYFDEHKVLNYCPHWFTNTDLIDNTFNISAPLWQQILTWFREKYNLFINIYYDSVNNYWKYVIFFLNEFIHDIKYNKIYFNTEIRLKTYEEAREESILKAIEVIKNK